MDLNSIGLEEALNALGMLLADRGLFYEIVAIGGGSLLLLGQIERPTKDLDLVAIVKQGRLISAAPIPQDLLKAIEEVAVAFELTMDWINPGPTVLLQMGLPKGFMERTHSRRFNGLTIYLADRFDQIFFKLYASVDQGPESKHFADLMALKPSALELEHAKIWCMGQDVSEAFEMDINKVLEIFHAM